MAGVDAAAYITAELDALRAAGRQVDLPTGDLAYGVDLVCVNDITPDAAELDPESTMSIAQDLYHRLITERGGVDDDKDFGFPLTGLLHKGTTARDLAMAGTQIAGECEKDDRVALAEVSVTAPDSRSRKISIIVTPVDPARQAFSMIIAVTDGGALLEATTAKG